METEAPKIDRPKIPDNRKKGIPHDDVIGSVPADVESSFAAEVRGNERIGEFMKLHRLLTPP